MMLIKNKGGYRNIWVNVDGYEICEACDCGEAESLLTAIERGGDVNSTKYDYNSDVSFTESEYEEHGEGLNPLMYTSRTISAGHLQCMRILIDNGANLNAKNLEREKKAPLHYAVENNNVDAINILLESGAEINVVDYDANLTPLMLSILLGEGRCYVCLLERGADVSIPNYQYQTCLEIHVYILQLETQILKL